MKIINTKNLNPGMITAMPVITRMGETLLSEHTILSTQYISYLEYYNIKQIFIYDDSDLTSSDVSDYTSPKFVDEITYSAQVRQSKDFKHFKKTYSEKVYFVHHSLNDIVVKNEQVNQNRLLNQVSSLYNDHNTSISVFDMLHNMRQIDDSTYAHSVNVSLISRMLGIWLNFSERDLEILTIAGLLHDIGKCRIDDSILLKPGKLTLKEYDEIKKHPQLGYEILSKQSLDIGVRYAALMHHECSDGSGYPMGLKNNQINDFAQIVTIADIYDAMTANRCYRKGLCPFEVIATFERMGLCKYNPKFIMTFLEHIVDTYMNNNALLNNGKKCKIVYINKNNLSKPIVKLEDNSFLDLSTHSDIFIESII